MKTLTKSLKFAARAALLTLVLTGTVFAMDLGQAKSEGLVGEKPDGYLGLVDSGASSDVRALVQDVNAKRRANYQRIAKQQGAPLAEVEKVGGMTAIDKTQRGHYVMDASGRWVKK
ncbi:DUF1318 domain-containing protein [Marinihelvus fidelis]|uniref:DUF1318 domain-containing protein n=1 Tax=Marinihelvus fidelis TaxID=2613842 RepID=A0A5N0TD85_9GAMM|nr:YdbL family protein [Marinihelvus fidelis]KAA9132648.1 DUF1318 domain-containing protein [Marinihelvus fidelis]